MGGTLQETALSESDLLLGSSIVSIIYSDSFKSRVVRLSKERFCTNKIKDYGALMQFFKEDFNKLTSEYGIDRKINKNYTCVLYIKLLYCFSYYGPLIQADMPSMICIDEGQDISIKHYELIDNINRGNTVMNIYGDLEQRIAPDSSISSWDELADIISCKILVN